MEPLLSAAAARARAAAAGAAALARAAAAHPRGAARLAAYHVMGAVFAAPVLARLALRALLHPRAAFSVDLDVAAIDALPDPVDAGVELRHDFINVGGGVQLHAVRAGGGGGGDKPALLFVHGFPEYCMSWRHQLAAFAGEYEVVAVDLRGYGRTEVPEPLRRRARSFAAAAAAGDVAAAARALGAPRRRVALVGHDWGGHVCWTAAAAHPGLFWRLAVLCCPHPRCFRLEGAQILRSWYIFTFQLPYIPELLFRAFSYALFDALLRPGGALGPRRPGALSRADIDRYKREFARPGRATSAIDYYRQAMRGATVAPPPAGERAAGRRRVEVPTLVIWAADDPFLSRRLLRGTERHVETLRVEVLEDCSHWAQLDRPERVNALITDFLGGGGGGGAAVADGGR